MPHYNSRAQSNKAGEEFMRDPWSILITGASSGIGEALALEYAAAGVFLALTGRDPARTAAVADAHRHRPLDLAIANAGISAGTGAGGESAEQAKRILAVNIDGVLNTLFPAIDLIRAKPRAGGAPRGQVAIMSSLAGLRGFPGAPAYCASKAAVKVWGEALRGELHAQGIEVSVICPGYVRTPMTQSNRFRMPLIMSAARAAQICRRGLAANRARIAFPWLFHFLLSLVAAAPPGWTDPLFRRLPKKRAET